MKMNFNSLYSRSQAVSLLIVTVAILQACGGGGSSTAPATPLSAAPIAAAQAAANQTTAAQAAAAPTTASPTTAAQSTAAQTAAQTAATQASAAAATQTPATSTITPANISPATSSSATTPSVYTTGMPANFDAKGITVASDGRFTAISSTGQVSESLNGTAWSPAVTGTIIPAGGIRNSKIVGSRFIALGDNVSSSADGRAWTNALNQSDWPLPSRDVAYRPASVGQAEVYVASGTSNSSTQAAILRSLDGATWVPIVIPSMTNLDWSGVAYGNGKFVAVNQSGMAATSSDGVAWTVNPAGVTGGQALQSITFSATHGRFFAGANGGPAGAQSLIYSSADGITWTSQASGTTFNVLRIACAGVICVAATSSATPTILTSTNQAAWTSAFPAAGYGSTFFVQSIIYSGTKWIAVGGSGLLLDSSNGTTWSLR